MGLGGSGAGALEGQTQEAGWRQSTEVAVPSAGSQTEYLL